MMEMNNKNELNVITGGNGNKLTIPMNPSGKEEAKFAHLLEGQTYPAASELMFNALNEGGN
jgi:hypothetical protein